MNGVRLSVLSVVFAVATTGSVLSADSIRLKQIATHQSGVFDESAAEIVAFDATSNRLYVVNGHTPSIDIMVLGGTSPDAATLTEAGSLNLADTEAPTSVTVHDGLIAAAVHNDDEEGDPSQVIFFDSDGNRLNAVATGSLTDMVTFTPDGRFVLAANEGEPDDNIDPEGSVSIIDVSGGAANATVKTVTFQGLSADDMRAKGVRVFPGKTPAEDFEPEYVAVSADSKTAFVSLQENNALAKIDIGNATLIDVFGLGTKDHSIEGNGLDPHDKDDAINIGPVPVRGMYMPDAIATFDAGGQTYVITANEGDARDEDERVKKADIDPAALTGAQKDLLERLKISTIDGDTDGDGDIDVLHAYGARSITIWDADGNRVSDTGDDFEQITARYLGNNFNSTNDENKGENRSDDKGPEPEGVDTGVVGGKTYAFIGLERVGGIMVYDVTDPAKPTFVSYDNNRNFTGSLDFSLPSDLAIAGDLGPEGILFIPEDDSPLGVPLLAVASEVSGTVTIYAILPG